MTASTSSTRELPTAEACWTLLQRIASSKQLRRAARLQELLFYLGKCALKDGCGEIHEQKIGVEVFKRPEGYDTSVDNIVRTSMSELRKRIDSYFASEGSAETLVMEIPRWNYVPLFRYRTQTVVLAVEPELQKDTSDRPHSSQLSAWTLGALIAAGLAIVLLAALSLSLWSRYRSLSSALYAWRQEPEVADLWNGILDARPNTDVVIADASFGLLQDINKKRFPFDEYIDRGYIAKLEAQEQTPEMHSIINRIAIWNLGSQDEFKLAQRILALDPLGKRIHLYSARDYMPDLTQQDNVILIGGSLSNPWDDLFENHMNFVTTFNSDGTIAVLNRKPAAGEQAIYTQTPSVEYCVVSYLPNPDHQGVVLLIEGTNAEATEAAGDFLLSEYQLSNFAKMLHLRRIPYFDVLLKVSSIPGTPLSSSIEAYRAYPNLH